MTGDLQNSVPKTQWKNALWWTLGAFIVPLGIAGALWLYADWNGTKEWERTKAELEAKGERFDLASVVPPLVPEKRNFAAAPILRGFYTDPTAPGAFRAPMLVDAARLLTELKAMDFRSAKWDGGGVKRPSRGRLDTGTMTDFADWQRGYRADKTFPQAGDEATPPRTVLTALSRFDEPIEALRRAAATRPESRFPVRYDLGLRMQISHNSTLFKVTEVLTLRSIAELTEGTEASVTAAKDDLMLAWKCSDAIENEPIILPYVIRVSMGSLIVQALWEGLVRHAWSEEQLRDFEARLARENFVAGMERAWRGERNVILLPSIRRDFLADHGHDVLAKFLPPGTYDSCRADAAEIVQELIDCGDPARRRIDARKADLACEHLQQRASASRNPLENYMLNVLLPGYSLIAGRGAWAQDVTNLARVAIALERHRIQNGAYPRALRDLDRTKLFVDGLLPVDVVNGTEPKYLPRPDGTYRLYYDGWNGKDDGGAAIKDTLKSDVVWEGGARP